MLGFLIYFVGTLSCVFAGSLDLLLAGRILQGVGAAGPYVLSVAIVRDLYKGRDMAQIMSLILMVFSWCLLFYLGAQMWLLATLVVTFSCVSVFLFTRPEPPRES